LPAVDARNAGRRQWLSYFGLGTIEGYDCLVFAGRIERNRRGNHRHSDDDRKREQLLQNTAIVRNRLKIAAAIQNAKSFLATSKEFGTFDRYIWQFVAGVPKQRKRGQGVPTHSDESDAMSKDLSSRGFKFVGSTICYAFMQAVGLVNDHNYSCFRYRELR